MPKVSVIIPCYNQGHFLKEAVDSVLGQSFEDYEIIIVNDGSTDEATKRLLAEYSPPKTTILTTDNQGLASARNNGIAASSGTYILPLDADDKIGSDYLKEAVAILETMPEVGIVNCRAKLFGAVETEWSIPSYTLEAMLLDNLIFCSSFFRRSDWEKVGGYDPGMIHGWEDYDFWLSLIEDGREVYRIDNTHFHYRVSSDSMVRSKEKWQKAAMFKRIFERHESLFTANIDVWIDALLDAKDRYYTGRLYLDLGDGFNDRDSIPRKIELGTRELNFNLSTYKNVKAIRFDPVDVSAVIEIEAVQLKTADGGMSKISGMTSNALYVDNEQLYFDTTDPRCFFPELSSDSLNKGIELSIHVRFHALGEDALRSIVEYQKEKKTSFEKIKSRYMKMVSRNS
jgi:glycosyltransferase involved in cell wall biosynthesis